MKEADLKELIQNHGAVLHGHFKLASGRHSDIYVEKFRVLERPAVLERICAPIAEHFAAAKPDLVAGPSTGGIVVAYEVARQLGLPAIYVESVEGKRTLRRGGRIEEDARVLLVDDVLTTGVSLFETLTVINQSTSNVVGVGVLIDRSGKDIGLPYELFAATRFEATSYAEDEIPEWLAKIPLTTPGTRASTARSV